MTFKFYWRRFLCRIFGHQWKVWYSEKFPTVSAYYCTRCKWWS